MKYNHAVTWPYKYSKYQQKMSVTQNVLLSTLITIQMGTY